MIDDDTIAAWRANYGLDERSPQDAARWWRDTGCGMAPAGAVAAVGLLLQERERLLAECERLRANGAPA